MDATEQKPKSSEEITAELTYAIKEAAHWFGGWDELRKIIADLEDNDNEAAFQRWSEDRYSING